MTITLFCVFIFDSFIECFKNALRDFFFRVASVVHFVSFLLLFLLSVCHLSSLGIKMTTLDPEMSANTKKLCVCVVSCASAGLLSAWNFLTGFFAPVFVRFV